LPLSAPPVAKGRHHEGAPGCGSGRGARARTDTVRSRAASGPRSSGTTTGPRGARCTGAGEGPPVCTRWFQETRPGAESGVTAWREPRWSAERRARSAERAAFARSADGWRHPLRGEAPRDSRAYRRSASLHFLRRQDLWLWSASLGRDASRERERLLHPPLQGEGRAPQVRRVGSCDSVGLACHLHSPTCRAARGSLPLQGRLQH
jgi:hypothetical protein